VGLSGNRLEVDDSAETTRTLAAAGASVIAEPTRTPWNSLNARLEAPGGIPGDYPYPVQTWKLGGSTDFAMNECSVAELSDGTLMLNILDYLRDYADQYHHPREDEAFRRLVRHRADRELPLARLRQEHRVIAHAGVALKHLLEEAAADAMVSRSEIEVAAATYLVYYGNHIAMEEEDILPLAGATLDADDWKAMIHAQAVDACRMAIGQLARASADI